MSLYLTNWPLCHEVIWGSDVEIHIFLTLALVVGEWSASLTLLLLYPWGKSTQYPLHLRMGGPQSWSGSHVKRKILDPTRTRTLIPSSSSLQAAAILTILLTGKSESAIKERYCIIMPTLGNPNFELLLKLNLRTTSISTDTIMMPTENRAQKHTILFLSYNATFPLILWYEEHNTINNTPIIIIVNTKYSNLLVQIINCVIVYIITGGMFSGLQSQDTRRQQQVTFIIFLTIDTNMQVHTLHNSYSLPNIIRIIKLTIRLAGHVTWGMLTGLQWESQKEEGLRRPRWR